MKHIFIVILLNNFAITCISYPSDSVLSIKPLPRISTGNLVPASFEFRYFRSAELTNLAHGASELIQDAMLSTGNFSDVVVGRNDNMLFFEIKAKEKVLGIPPFYGFSYILSALTLCIIPGYEHHQVTLTVNLYKEHHVFYKQIQTSGDKVIIFWLPFFPSGQSDIGALKEVAAKLMIDIINQLQGDPVITSNPESISFAE